MTTEEAAQIALKDLIKTCQLGITESETRVLQALRNESANDTSDIQGHNVPSIETNQPIDTKRDTSAIVLIIIAIISLLCIAILALSNVH